MAGKYLVELCQDEVAGAATRTQPPEGGMVDARILGHPKIGAERQFLKYAADAEALCQSDRIGGLRRTTDLDAASVRRQRAGEDMHQR